MKLLLRIFVIFLIFHENVFSQISSNLPIFKINTHGKTIVDEPKINASLQVIFDSSGGLNNSNSTTYHFDGFCGVEYRGSYSQYWPKKNLSIELRSDTITQADIDFPLLNLPAESDWILVANYNDSETVQHSFFHLLENENRIVRRV